MTDVESMGEAAVLLWLANEKRASDAMLSYGLRGKLQLSKSGWLLLTVPNDLGIGAFKALNAPGAELPVSETTGQYNAHVSVMRPEEIESIGGANRITERGKEFSYTLGPVREVRPDGWDEMEKVWFIEVHSPELERVRRSYGLSSLPNNGEYRFHITFSVRRKKVLRPGDLVVKRTGGRGSLIHNPKGFLHKTAGTHEHAPSHPSWEAEKAAMQGNLDDLPGDGFLGAWFDPRHNKALLNFGDWASPETIGAYKAAFASRVAAVETTNESPPPTQANWIKLAAANGVTIKESPIEGRGLFATRSFEPGDIVVARAMAQLKGEDGLTRYEQSQESRFTNHSCNPNVMLRKAENYVELVAIRPIVSGEELTGDYNTVEGILGPGFYFSYLNKKYNGESSSGHHLTEEGKQFTGGDQREKAAAEGATLTKQIAAGSYIQKQATGKGRGILNALKGFFVKPNGPVVPLSQFPTTSSLRVGRIAALGTGAGVAGYHALKPLVSPSGISTTSPASSASTASPANTVTATATPESPFREWVRGLENYQMDNADRLRDSIKERLRLAVLDKGGSPEWTINGSGLYDHLALNEYGNQLGYAEYVRNTSTPKSRDFSSKYSYRQNFKKDIENIASSWLRKYRSADPAIAEKPKPQQPPRKPSQVTTEKTPTRSDKSSLQKPVPRNLWLPLILAAATTGVGAYGLHRYLKNRKAKKDEEEQEKTADFADKLDDLLFRRDPSGISRQHYDVALRATPIGYNLAQNPLQNILGYASRVQNHAQKQVAQAQQHERFLNAANPGRASAVLQQSLQPKLSQKL